MPNDDLQRDLAELRTQLDMLRAHVDRSPRRRWAWPAVAVALVSSLAWAQLVTFNADEPAFASDVNGNFNQLKTWLEQKVGAVGTSTITANGLALADGTGITSTRFGVAAPVINAPTTNFGPGFLEGTFLDAGGTIVIMASATGYCTAIGRITMQVKVDGVTVGSMRVTCNETNQHMAFPAAFIRLNRSVLPATGFTPPVTRTVRLEPINCTSGCGPGLVTTTVDVNDFGEVTVLRLPTP